MIQNRIVGLTTKRASDLTANPLNWRTHPFAQRNAVSASLKTLGWVDVVIENIETGYLIDGHERVWQAMENDDLVPVLQVRLSLDEERLALAVLDPLTSMAKTDGVILDELLSVIACTNETLNAVLDNIASTSGLALKDDISIFDSSLPEERIKATSEEREKEELISRENSLNNIICPDCGSVIENKDRQTQYKKKQRNLR
jgi:hypothetical protein